MAKFQFAILDRVTVPGSEDVQGIIQARTERRNKQPSYLIVHLDNDGQPVGGDYAENTIIAAQPVALTIGQRDGSTYAGVVKSKRTAAPTKASARKRR